MNRNQFLLIKKDIFVIIIALKMKNYLKYLSIIILVVFANLCYGPPPPPPKGGPPCWPPPCIPINNGIHFLILGGFLLIVYKLIVLRRKNANV
jgi:hypothetical protein